MKSFLLLAFTLLLAGSFIACSSDDDENRLVFVEQSVYENAKLRMTLSTTSEDENPKTVFHKGEDIFFSLLSENLGDSIAKLPEDKDFFVKDTLFVVREMHTGIIMGVPVVISPVLGEILGGNYVGVGQSRLYQVTWLKGKLRGPFVSPSYQNNPLPSGSYYVSILLNLGKDYGGTQMLMHGFTVE